MDIGESVKRVNLLARQHYRENQLYPALSKLMEASETTVTLMGDLNNSLKCDSLFRWKDLFEKNKKTSNILHSDFTMTL